MADLSAWPPERLRALDRAVAEAQGKIVAFNMPDGPDGPKYPRIYVAGDMEPLPPVSLGCREMFELQIKGFLSLTHGASTDTWYIELERDEVDEPSINGPTIPIAWCLAYLDSEGVPFNG